MNLKNYYYYFQSAVPARICDEIVKYGKSISDQMAVTGGFGNKKLNQSQVKDLKKKRNSNVVWMNDRWIYKEIQPYVHQANANAGWNFQWDFSENAQFTKYKLNEYYDWHSDNWEAPYDNPNSPQHSKIRKLSMTCQLTDGSEYEGGELEFDFRDYDPALRDEAKHVVQAKDILPKGSIIIFPSNTWHRVKPVTAGIRYSLVVWHLGNPFI